MPMRSFSRSTSTTTSIPLFLAPAFSSRATCQSLNSSRSFTNTNALQKQRHKTDKNKQRGVSAIRSTGPRHRLSIWKYPLPKPVDNPEKRAEFAVDQDHGLWGFFNETKQPMISPEDEGAHGRAWEYQELSYKSFEDLHKLHWTCIKEINRCLTRAKEMNRLKAGYGALESEVRVNTIRTTLKRIQAVLLDRQTTWEQARAILEKTTVRDLFENGNEQTFEDDQPQPQRPV